MSDLFSFTSQYLTGYIDEVFRCVVLLMFTALPIQIFGWIFGRR